MESKQPRTLDELIRSNRLARVGIGPRRGGIDVASLQDWLFDRLRVGDTHVARVLIEVSEEEGDGVQWVVRLNAGGPHWWQERVTTSDVEGEESEVAVALLGAVDDQETFERGMLDVHEPPAHSDRLPVLRRRAARGARQARPSAGLALPQLRGVKPALPSSAPAPTSLSACSAVRLGATVWAFRPNSHPQNTKGLRRLSTA